MATIVTAFCVLLGPYKLALLSWSGVVGYRICLTHRRSPVRAGVRSEVNRSCFAFYVLSPKMEPRTLLHRGITV
jgi:hypothetical protein